MKAILLSVRPEHAVHILNGNKTRELRKRVPKDFVGPVYIYVTKRKPRIAKFPKGYFEHKTLGSSVNGKVVARFWFDKFDKTTMQQISVDDEAYIVDVDALCLSYTDILDYGKGEDLYAWHIKNLEIFDEPMQLEDFGLKRPPQSWQYVYIEGKLKN